MPRTTRSIMPADLPADGPTRDELIFDVKKKVLGWAHVWRECENNACHRARACADPVPCVGRYDEGIMEFLRQEIVPEIRRRQAAGLLPAFGADYDAQTLRVEERKRQAASLRPVKSGQAEQGRDQGKRRRVTE